MRKTLIISIFSIIAILISPPISSAQRYAGGDISLLPEYEKAGAQYKTHDGKPIADLLPWLHEQGMNAMRVRLFVNPDDYTGSDKDPNACQDLDYILPLCKRIKEAGLKLMLDFHYSDTWADPAKQWTPAAWAGLSDEQLYDKIYSYTKESLQALAAEGVTPDFIQPGNEISFGMLWGPYGTPLAQQKRVIMGKPDNWSRLGRLLNRAIEACREICPEAKIIIHTERTADIPVLRNFYDYMKALKVNYDIIGLSYYPYFHAKLNSLSAALDALQTAYPDKKIMIVETGYPYKWEVPGTTEKVDYEYSDAGQNKFASELVDLLLKHPEVDGLFWWWLEYNAYGAGLSNWYNAPLFDSTTGRACSALKTICSFALSDSGVITLPAEIPAASRRAYDINGNIVDPQNASDGIYIINGQKILIHRK